MALGSPLVEAAGVVLRDLHPGDEQMLRRELPDLFSEQPGLDVYDEVIRKLVERGQYENVFVERKGDHFQITGKPLRVVEQINFKGLSEGDEAELRELLEFKPGDRFDRKKAVAGGEKMKAYYGERGFFNTVVEIDFKKSESKNILVNYEIQERVPCQIAGIEFLTPNIDLKEKLERRFSRLINRPLTGERVRKMILDLEEFLISNRYLSSEVTGPDPKYNLAKTQAFLTLQIKEPYRWEFYFSGYQFESLSKLYRALDLKNKERKNVDPAGEGSERLRRNYLNKGFPNIQIDTKVNSPPDSYLRRVYYTITENARVKIENIEVQGRISRNSNYYRKFILENSSDLVEEGFYNRQDLDNGFKNLNTELRNQGFLRAKILSSRIEYNEKRDKVTIVVLLEEGPQTQIRALDFEGNKFLSSFELSQISGLQTNSPLKLNVFETSIEKVKAFYRNLGFLEMKLLNEGEELIQYNEKGTQARILFRIFEGPRIRIHAIAVEGNSFTKNRVILKEADFRVGEVLTPQKIEDAIARLNRMGLFSRVDIRTLEEGTNVSERTLVISVGEMQPGIFSVGAGINSERKLTVRGFTGMSYNNLRGTGRGVSARVEVKQNVAEINYPEHEISAGYLEPFLFNTRTRGRISLTRAVRVFEYQTEYDFTRINGSNRLDLLAERDLDQNFKLTWKVWSLDLREEWEREGRCLPSSANVNFDPNLGKCSPDKIQIGTLGPILDVDFTDNRFLPTRGFISRILANYSHPELGSSRGVEFIHTEASHTYYKRFGSPNYVWANSIRGGYVANLSPEKDGGVPPSYAFVLGGISTIRGFDIATENERLPKQKDAGFEILGSTQKLIQTDAHFYLFKSELRFPIFNDHGGVVFYDGGAVLVAGFNFKRPYRDAVGFGYRYNTPVGPLAIDLAFKINPEPASERMINGQTVKFDAEDTFRLHLSIGTF